MNFFLQQIIAVSIADGGKTQLIDSVGTKRKGSAEAGKIIRFICGKSIVVFHSSACLLQDFCNLLYSYVLTMWSDYRWSLRSEVANFHFSRETKNGVIGNYRSTVFYQGST